MAIHIICPPGRYGGVITGHLDPEDLHSPAKLVFYRETKHGWTPHDDRFITTEPGARKPVIHEAIAARLWSCNLGYKKGERIPRWMVALTTPSFMPHDVPGNDALWLDHETVAASSLTIARVPGLVGRRFSGTMSPSTQGEVDGLFTYYWERDRYSAGDSGWVPLRNQPLMPRSTTWSATARQHVSGMQYAVLQVVAGKVVKFSTPREPILPIDAEGVHAVGLSRTIEIVVDSDPGQPMMGAITGLDAAYDHATRPLQSTSGGKEQLWLGMWALKGKSSELVDKTTCSISGHWSIGTPSAAARRASEFVLAVATRAYEPSDVRPVLGGEVIAVDEFEGDFVTGYRKRSAFRRS
jgi:hypothetical protein